MNLALPANQKHQTKTYLQRAGYHEFTDPNTGKTSYVRRLSGDFYPRFHAYLEISGGQEMISLHLDQKKPSYGGGTHAHGGEYDGATVERELERLKDTISGLENQPEEDPVNGKEKKGFFRRIFG